MGLSRKEYKELLFAQGVAALNRLGINGEIYGCPICSALFERKSLSDGTLTEEHVPQKAGGGRPLILTCKKCNNFAGQSFEAHYSDSLKAKRTLDAFANENSQVGPVKLKLGNITVNAFATRDKGVTDFLVSKDHNSPSSLLRFSEILAKSGENLQLDVILPHVFREDYVRLAELKSAFLACTAAFGYTFGLDRNLNFIRRQILDGVEVSYKARKVDLPSVPRNSIVIDRDYKRLLVKFDGPAILLPTQNVTEMEFISLVEARPPIVGGKFRRLPKSFEAVLDHQGLTRAQFT